MPSSTFPRPSSNEISVATVTAPGLPTGLFTRSHSGLVNLRSTQEVGWFWTENYNPMRAGDPDVESFLSYLRWANNRMEVLQVAHPDKPGSGADPNGLGASGVTVDGGSQTGSSIDTTGWPINTNNVVRAGDWISIVGVGFVMEVTDDANSDGSGNATINILPPIFEGNSPPNGAGVTTTGVTMNARLKDPSIPETTNAFYYGGLSLTFQEVP